MGFLDTFKAILPNGTAWSITAGKPLRSFFEGLTGLPEDARAFIDLVWYDIHPDTTRQIEIWENQFGLIPNDPDEAARREALLAAWRAIGGQSPGYLQDTLQAAGFDVYVHEWWEFTGPGGSRVTRDPRLYLDDGGTVFTATSGNPAITSGDPDATAGSTLGPTGRLLVNKISSTIGKAQATAGDPATTAGAPEATAGTSGGFVTSEKTYTIPSDPDTWVHFWYVGAATFPDKADVPGVRRDELDTLILKLKPAHTWVGLLANYT